MGRTRPTPPRWFSSTERDLGLDTAITRRDFLNASLIASGAALLSQPAPLGAAGPRQDPAAWEGYHGVGDYARSHGNMWRMMTDAHDLRDGTYASGIASAVDTGETYDLVVVGGGMSGLGAAYRFHELREGTCLVLDNHPMIGGEAKRNEFEVDGQLLIGPQGSNGFGLHAGSDWAGDYWRALGLPSGPEGYEYQQWARGVSPLELSRDNYFFQLWTDESESHGHFFREAGGSLRMVRNAFATGLPETPWSDRLRRDFIAWRGDPRFYEGDDLPRYLDGMTYEHLITKVLGFDEAVARYVDPVLANAAGGLGSDVISAQCAAQISLPGTQNGNPRFQSRRMTEAGSVVSSFPGGNDGIMRHVLKRLVPAAIKGDGFVGTLNGPIRFEALDRAGQPTRIRLGATAVRVANRQDGTVDVVFVGDGHLHRIRARGVVMANGAWSSQHIVLDPPAGYREAFEDFVRAPMLVVNVALRQWRFMYDLGITAASYRDLIGFSCNLRQGMVVGDYRPTLDPDRPTLLTLYIPFERPGLPLKPQAIAARTELLATSYADYERQIRQQLVRLFGRAGFDPRRDVAGIVLNRWGHAYVCPAPGFYFGRDGRPAAPDVLRQPAGRVAFANSELHGHQNWRDATAEGRRAVEQLFG